MGLGEMEVRGTNVLPGGGGGPSVQEAAPDGLLGF